MIEALALAAAMAGDLYYDTSGCIWRHAPIAAKAPRKPASAASAPKAKPKKRPSYAKPAQPADEFIGCDEAAPTPPITAIAPPFTFDEAPFSPVPMMPEPPPILTAAPPETFETVCDCAGGFVPVVYFVPIGGGPVFVPAAPVAPIPEPETWALLVAGLLLGMWRKARAA